MATTRKCSKCGAAATNGDLTCPLDGAVFREDITANITQGNPLEKTILEGFPSIAQQKPVTNDGLEPVARLNARSESATVTGTAADIDSTVAGTIPPSSSNKNDALVGTVLDNQYQILEKIGQGGMSVVYKARHNMLRKIVAIKTMLPHLVQHPLALQRFQQEAQAASNIVHTNVITIYNFGITPEGQPYLVMDYLEGKSLTEVIAQEKFLPVERAVGIFLQVANALADAHKKGVIHRDLKPSNVILIEQGEKKDVVQIVDFGIAKMLPQEGEEAIALTQTGEVFGSPLYMSPEQCKGEKLDSRADIYSLGCLMYETLTGRAPLAGSNTLEVLYKHINEMPPAMSNKQHPVPARLEAIVWKALAKLPADRYQSMDDVEQDLESFQKTQQWSIFSILRNRAELRRLKKLPQTKKEKFANRAIVVALLAIMCASTYPFVAFWNTANDPITRQPLLLDDDRAQGLEDRHEIQKKGWEIAKAQAREYLAGKPTIESASSIYGALIRQGEANNNLGNFQTALEAYEFAYEFSSKLNGPGAFPTIRALLEKGDVEYNMSKWEQAIESYKNFESYITLQEREHERTAFYEARLGNCYWNTGNVNEAKKAYHAAIVIWSKPMVSPAHRGEFIDTEISQEDMFPFALAKTRLGMILKDEVENPKTAAYLKNDYRAAAESNAETLFYTSLPLWRSVPTLSTKNLGITEIQLAEMLQKNSTTILDRPKMRIDSALQMRDDQNPELLLKDAVKEILQACSESHEYYAIALLRQASYYWRQHNYLVALQIRYRACEVLSRFRASKLEQSKHH
ncbi:MAG TPA: serine/threonine-protein kinase [Oculatellaceae cyanobacterium]